MVAWHIYLRENHQNQPNVGRYTVRPMDPKNGNESMSSWMATCFFCTKIKRELRGSQQPWGNPAKY